MIPVELLLGEATFASGGRGEQSVPTTSLFRYMVRVALQHDLPVRWRTPAFCYYCGNQNDCMGPVRDRFVYCKTCAPWFGQRRDDDDDDADDDYDYKSGDDDMSADDDGKNADDDMIADDVDHDHDGGHKDDDNATTAAAAKSDDGFDPDDDKEDPTDNNTSPPATSS